MKFLPSILLYSTLSSASLLSDIHPHLYRRDTSTPASTVSRDPLPGVPDVQTILNALQTIEYLTVNSTYTIGNFTDDLNQALAISTATGVINDATYNASQAVGQLGMISVSDAETLGAYTQGLAYSVNASIATLISKKPNFEKLGIASLVITSLQGLEFGSYVFSTTTLQKVPAELQSISAALSSQIGESIQEGIACFNGTNTSCITTIVNPDRTRLQAIANDTISAATGLRAGGFLALIVAIFAAVMAL